MRAAALILEILISTCGDEGGRRVEKMQLPQLPGVKYLISWQEPGESVIPTSLATRSDIKIVTLPGLGLSRNRNNCLDKATGDILLIADDDLEFYPDGLLKIIEIFAENSSLEYGSFRYDSDVAKIYPASECQLAELPKGFYQTSFEIALRRESRAGRLRFPENFGLGAEKFTAAEEELLLKKARINHLDCRFFPITIARHPGATTGVRSTLADGAILSRGVLTVIEFPFTSILRIPLAGWRISRAKQSSLFRALRLLTIGAFKGLFTQVAESYLKSPL